MKKTILAFLVSLLFLNCQHKKPHPVSKETEEINAVVQVLLDNDSLTFIKQTQFCIELKKITVQLPAEKIDGLVPPPIPGSMDINGFLQEKINGEAFFTSKDSAAIMAQNANPDRLTLDESILDQLNATTTVAQEKAKVEKGQPYNFCEMTIPIFSLDKQKAYVTLNHYCGGLCGNGTAIYLKKRNGKWKIVAHWQTWIS